MPFVSKIPVPISDYLIVTFNSSYNMLKVKMLKLCYGGLEGRETENSQKIIITNFLFLMCWVSSVGTDSNSTVSKFIIAQVIARPMQQFS